MKQCTDCGHELPLTAFGNHSITKDGLSHVCKECNRQRRREYGKTATGIYTQIKGRTTFRRKNTKRYRTYHGLSISREDFVMWYSGIPKICAYCDLPEGLLDAFFDSYNYIAERLTVDCVDNALGYAIGNLVLACKRCNSIKSDLFSFDEMRAVAQKYIKPKWMSKIQGSAK